MHHMRVLLNHHEFGEVDRPELAHFADVIAAQVDQHDMLGALLFIGQQLFGEPDVFLAVFTPAAGARDGPNLDFAVVHFYQYLR